jgi:hypothetical protein
MAHEQWEVKVVGEKMDDVKCQTDLEMEGSLKA